MILDTNAYVALKKNNTALIDTIKTTQTLFIPLPVIGELRYGFANGTQAMQNEEELTRFLANPNVEVLLPTLQTSEHYAQIAVMCQKSGRVMSHNDMWIAAIAKEYGHTFVTFDKDFEAVGTYLAGRLIILDHIL